MCIFTMGVFAGLSTVLLLLGGLLFLVVLLLLLLLELLLCILPLPVSSLVGASVGRRECGVCVW